MANSGLSRRQVLQLVAGMGLVPRVFERVLGIGTGTNLKDLSNGRLNVHPFALADVTLLSGPFKEAMQRDGAYMLKLNPDRFLYYFRLTAGLKPKGPLYGGWEKQVGRMLGHYLSACSMMYASTGDKRFSGRAAYIVDQIRECQRANGNGYVGGIPESKRLFSEIAAGRIEVKQSRLNGVHAPWYMMHKLMAGLRDAYLYTGNEDARETLIRLSEWTFNLLRDLPDAQFQKMLLCEPGGMNEVLADVYVLTGDRKYAILGERFNRNAVIDPLMGRKDDLTGLHANTQLAALVGLARLYEVTGRIDFETGSIFFWQEVAKKRSYVTGGNSDHEHFFPIGDMGQHLSAATAETCNTYNILKLTRHLFCWEPKAEYADFYERALFNHILGSQDPETGMMTYYYSLKPGHFKTFSTPFDSFWCCVGTGMENHSKYGNSIYFHDNESLYVNLFIASELDWRDRRLKIRQETRFPEEQTTRLLISDGGPAEVTLNIRQPYWATAGLSVTINGKPHHTASHPSSFVPIRRNWRKGDTVEVSLPMELHVEPMPDDPTKFAILYGPIVLAGNLGMQDYHPPMPYAGNNQLAYVKVPDPGVPSVSADGKPIGEWVRPVTGKPLKFRITGADGAAGTDLLPAYAANHLRYTVYWNSQSPTSETGQRG